MKQALVFGAALSLTFCLAGVAQSTTQTASQPTQMSRRGLHSLMQSAHENAQYETLADYFRQKEQSFRVKEDAEFLVWAARAHGIAANGNKFPRPVDSARNLYDYYAYETDHAAAQAQHYDHLTAMAQSIP